MEGGAVGHNIERYPPKDHPCQVWFNSVPGFQRRRFKCESLRRTTAIKMYEAYVIPKLLYGVEILPLNATQTALLSKFHIANLRRLQSLPTRTAIGIVYLLVGAMPN
jgi:hypothetical protein